MFAEVMRAYPWAFWSKEADTKWRRGVEVENVRFGSKADMRGTKRHVRFTPNSDRESGHHPSDLMSSQSSIISFDRAPCP
jgi:hypothetical protein